MQGVTRATIGVPAVPDARAACHNRHSGSASHTSCPEAVNHQTILVAKREADIGMPASRPGTGQTSAVAPKVNRSLREVLARWHRM